MIFIASCTNWFLIVRVELVMSKWHFQLNTAVISLGYTLVDCYHGVANEEVVDLVQGNNKLLV